MNTSFDKRDALADHVHRVAIEFLSRVMPTVYEEQHSCAEHFEYISQI